VDHLHERPKGANATDPSVVPHAREAPAAAYPNERRDERRVTLPWEPSDPARWAHLNLSDPPENGILPKDALVPDALAWALVSPEADDPIEGIVDGVKIELEALADSLKERGIGAMLGLLARRLDVACILLRYTDNRSPMPTEPADPPEDEPTSDSVDPEITRDALPGGMS
jgi:hypothetical protein